MKKTLFYFRSSCLKAFHGQALVELMGVIAPMFLIVTLIATAGWWTYGRMNAISQSYFVTMQIATYNSPDRISDLDSNFQPVTTGKAFWFDVQYYGSGNTVWVVFPIPAIERLKWFYIRGTIMTANPDKRTDDPSQYYMIWASPILEKYGNPKSTLPGSWCWYCSSQAPSSSP